MINKTNWKVYKQALIPANFPHEEIASIQELPQFLKLNKCYFARYATNFDCKEETQWYWLIKDTSLDISLLKANRRATITKGLKYFTVKIINPVNFKNELFDVLQGSLADYPPKYRNSFTQAYFYSIVDSWVENEWDCFGAFDKETNKLCGYALAYKKGEYAEYMVVKTLPQSQKKQINAAIAYQICERYLNEHKVKILYAGERNIRHETNYQDYLIKNFGFRLAYCKLNIIYRPWVKFIVNLLYPFRKIIKHISSLSPILYNVYSVLKQEEIRRTF